MNEKLTFSTLFAIITAILVITLGLFHGVLFTRILLRAILFTPIMWGIGFFVGYLLFTWEKEIAHDEFNPEKNNVFSKGFDVKEDSKIDVDFINPKGNSGIIKAQVDDKVIDVQPKKAADAIRRMLSEEEK